MKSIRILPAALCFILSTGFCRADLVIVQAIDNKAAGMNQNMEITMKLKGDRARIDMGGQMSSIIDGGTGDMITLMHSQKATMTMKGEQLKAMMEQFAKTQDRTPTSEVPPLVSTGKTETINGFATEEFTHVMMGNTINYWIAKDYPNYRAILEQMTAFSKNMGQMASPGVQQVKPEAFPGLPIRTEVTMSGGTGTVISTIVSVEEKSVEASEFNIPADYKAIEVPTLGTPPSAPAPVQEK